MTRTDQAEGRATLPASKYEPAIDGLRAIAVVAVLLFHAGIAPFGGGFVGVDIFFVISGYLITTILLTDLERGNFSIRRFYERRVRRIAPALLFVLGATLAIGMLVLLPSALSGLAWSALNALTFSSNIYFWLDSGYFAQGASSKPLLHTWSLAVEEQFYLFYPIVLWLLHRRGWLKGGVFALFAVSLILCIAGTPERPSASFYLLPTRGWELMMGALVALDALPRFKGQAKEWAAGAGLLLIGLPIFLYTEHTEFPGIAAVPPCLGAAALLLAIRSGGGWVTRSLASAPMVGVGLISYSLYLWHWPMLVFARVWQMRELTTVESLACLGLAFLLAWVSWRFVEQPFRNRRRMSMPVVLRWTGAATVATALLAAAATTGLPQRLPDRALMLARTADDRPETLARCVGTSQVPVPCPIGVAGKPTFAVWGDSHALAFGEAVGEVARAKGQSGMILALHACVPGYGDSTLPPIPIRADARRCRDFRNAVDEKLIADPAIRQVILIAFWQQALDGSVTVASGVEASIRRLRKAGKQVTMIGDLPVAEVNLPETAAFAAWWNRPFPRAYRTAVDPLLSAIAARSGARLISLSPLLCPTGQCRTIVGGRPAFIDQNHISRTTGREIIAPALTRAAVL